MPAPPASRPPARDLVAALWHVVDAYGATLGPYGLALYLVLVRRANAEAQCSPSYEELATATRMSRRKVIATAQALRVLELVEIRRSRVRGHRNTFILLDPPGAPGEGAE